MKMVNQINLVELVEDYNSGSDCEKKEIIAQIAKMKASDASFDDWDTAFSEIVDDIDVKSILAKNMYETARDFNEWMSGYFAASEMNLVDEKEILFGRMIKHPEGASVNTWINIYDDEKNKQLKEAAFRIIASRDLDFQQWLMFCTSNISNENHLEYAMQMMYNLESSFMEWFDICRDDFNKDQLKLLALKVVSEKKCTFEELVDAYNKSEDYPDQRLVVMDRFSTIKATREQWLGVFEEEPSDILGVLAETKLTDDDLLISDEELELLDDSED